MQTLIVLGCLLAAAAASPAVVGYSSVVPAVGAPYAAYYVAPQALAALPIAGLHAQYHAQDGLGRASYGHAEPLQAHNAVQDAAGNKVGSFSYVAPDGKVVRTDYVADAAGYRVASNALPVGPAPLSAIAARALPQPVQDTPEVAAAKAAHLAEVAAVRARSKRDVAAVLPYAHSVVAPVSAYSSVVSPISAYSSVVAPYSSVAAYPSVVYPSAARVGSLTTVVNNPGYAVSYQVN